MSERAHHVPGAEAVAAQDRGSGGGRAVAGRDGTVTRAARFGARAMVLAGVLLSVSDAEPFTASGVSCSDGSAPAPPVAAVAFAGIGDPLVGSPGNPTGGTRPPRCG